MLRTEEEARKCWCPFARYGAGECAVNRDIQSDHFGSGNKCIASECMAWRWKVENPAATVGFCGLAGQLG